MPPGSRTMEQNREKELPAGGREEQLSEQMQEFKPGGKFWFTLAPLLVVACMTSLDSTSVSVALPVSSLWRRT